MKRLFLALCLTLGILAATAIPSQAALPPDVSGDRFYTGHVCVGSTLNQTTYPVGAMAQAWNVAVSDAGNLLALDYSTNCAADGYTPSRRMVIGTYNNPADLSCFELTNGNRVAVGNAFLWTDGPGMYINIGRPNCVSTPTRRKHVVSAAIGRLLGLRHLTSDGWNSRVMNNTAWSFDNVPTADQTSADRVWEIYAGEYDG
jgi:hypothetical protein